ncbi:MAG: hypothetical protein RL339_384 [Pseudomonadota bacterium]|jgi:hypothetical protein
MRRITPCAALVLLAACQQEPAAPQPTQTAAAAAPNAPLPGRYRVTMKVKAVSFPGMTERMARQASTLFGGTAQISEFCLTPQEAGKGREAFFKRAVEGDCRYEGFTAQADKFDAVLVCQTGQGMSARSELSGSFTATGSQVAIRTTSEVPGGPGGSMVLDADIATERLGDCI